MKKIFGIEAEINITTDEGVAKCFGKGLAKGSLTLNNFIKEIKPELVKKIKDYLLEDKKQDKKGEKDGKQQ